MPRNRQPQHRAPRPCSKCGEPHTRDHSWCIECYRAANRIRNADRRAQPFGDRWAPSKPPPPPPGYDAADLNIGRPLDR